MDRGLELNITSVHYTSLYIPCAFPDFMLLCTYETLSIDLRRLWRCSEP